MQQVVGEFQRCNQLKATLLPWIICFAASLFFFYEFIQGNMFASIADDVMKDFHIQADKMSYLSSIYYLSNVIFLLVAGILLDRYSAKTTILIAMFFCVLSTFVLANSHSFYMALLSRFVTGIGSAFCFLGPIRIASRWFPPKRMALVTGAIVTMAMTGGMLAQYPLTWLVAQIGWRDSLVCVAWLGLAIWLFMAYWIQDKPDAVVEPVHIKMSVLASAKKMYCNRQTIGAALYTSLMNMGVAVFGAMMGSLYLVQRLGVSKEDAAIVNSMLFLGAILGGPFIGWCSDKLGVRVMPMRLGAIASLLTIIAILYMPVSWALMAVLFFLLGFFTASQVISYAFVAENTPPAMTATAISLISILTQGGYILYQNLYSYLLVNHGDVSIVNSVPVYSLADYQTAAIILPIGLFIAWLISYRLKETHCRQSQQG